VVEPFGAVVVEGDEPIGLALAEERREEGVAELLSVYVRGTARREGHAKRLLAAVEDEARRRGLVRLAAVYMSGRAEIDWMERAFRARGWAEPQARTVTLRFTPEQALATPWFGRLRLGPGYEVFPWTALTPAERQELMDSQARATWIFPALEPWRHDRHGFEEVSSLGLRHGGKVVGWVINHRVSPELVRFTCSFMRKDLGRRGRILPLFTESLRRLREVGCPMCTFVTPVFYGSMVEFVRERCAPWAEFFGETRGVSKALG
jgi:hypothetical protein